MPETVGDNSHLRTTHRKQNTPNLENRAKQNKAKTQINQMFFVISTDVRDGVGWVVIP